MMFPTSKAIALAGLLSHAAAAFPEIDIAKLCAGVPELDASDKAMRVCRQSEAEARDRLRSLWPKLKATEKTVCGGEIVLGVALSYVEIAGCIDMNRELRREKGLKPEAAAPASR